jgi:dipeptidyl aminopeptidase/acylaminoacyl peptidase
MVMGMSARSCGGLVAIALSLFVNRPAAARCENLLPGEGRATIAPARNVELNDLVRLRDIGPTASGMFLNHSPFGVSPDGKRIAFQLRQADPDANDYCLAMVVMDLRSANPPTVVDRGGTMIRVRFRRGSLAGYYAGDAKLIAPIWSRDGKTIAFLKQTGAHVQVWIARTDGSSSRQLTHAPVDVEAFAWAADGRSIVFQTRPALEEERQAITREGLSGYLYDERWSPVASNHPWPSEPKASTFELVYLDGNVRAASRSEQQQVEHSEGIAAPNGAGWVAASSTALAWIAPANLKRGYYDGQIQLQRPGRPIEICDAAECRGNFRGLWWDSHGETLWFLRRGGWANSELALYTWKPGGPAPRSVLRTRDLLLGCERAEDRLVCAVEQSARPRSIISIDPSNGSSHDIYDPNPEFRRLRLGAVERVEWRNDRGIEIYGDLVLPPDWRPSAQRLPLIIVQYQTRGFLRGGTNDEFPIFAFAAAGFAVLSLERPGYVADQVKTSDADERNRLNYEDWADRRSVLSAYATGIALLEKRGLIDPTRVGITGMSDGTASAQFALVSSNLFAAASLSACCEEPKTLLPLLGSNGTRYLRKLRYPAYTDDNIDFWAPYSIARNAVRFRTPLLLQSADDEYMMTLETYASLREYGAPVELIVFPNEHHMKWQPAHRLALYRRNLAWFSFWLTGTGQPYATSSEVERWSEMQQASKAATLAN